MPQAIPAVFIAIGQASIVAGLKYLVTTVLINVALGEISKALVGKPKQHAPPINVTIRNTVENRRLLFGTVRAGGAIVFYDVSGDNNKYLWYVVVYAGHQCEAIKDVWLDTNKVTEASIGAGAAGGGAVASGLFANKLWIYKHLGTGAQTVDTEMDAAFSTWTANHRLRGCAYAVVKMERDDNAFPQGAPQDATALVDGALCYDPRLDTTNGGSGSHRRDNPSTWEFSRNPAIHWRHYVSGGSVHNDTTTRLIRYGLREDDSRIPDDYVAAAADICDEQLTGANETPDGEATRYFCDLEVSCGETRREIIEHILATMAGSQVTVHGQHRVFAGAYDAPTHSFTQADLYGQLEVEDTHDHQRRYNAVAAVFRDASKSYIEQTTPFRKDAAYETQDGGKRIPIEIDLRGVTDQYQAARLCEIKLRKSRMMRSVKLIGALNLLKVAQNETLSYSHVRYDWASRTFRCLERQLEFTEEAGRVSLTCQREDAAVYTDLETADYTTGTSETDTFQNESPDPPTNLRSTGLQNAVLWQWDRPAVMFPGTSYESRISTASAMTSPTTAYAGPDLQYMLARTTTADVFAQVRSIRNGQASAWVPATNGVLGKASSVQLALSATVDPGLAESEGGGASQVTNSVTAAGLFGTSPYGYAWTWASGGSGITIDAASSATTTFSATGLGVGETRSGRAQCEVEDDVLDTYIVEVDVEITRLAPELGVPFMFLDNVALDPSDADVCFKFDNDGHWYSGTTSPTTDRGLWVDPPEYAADYEIRITRTGGSETNFASGPALGSYHSLGTDRTWTLQATVPGVKQILFTIDIRTISGPGTPETTTDNTCQVAVEA